MIDSRSIPNFAEIVIIGGGAIGLSIAYHLAERGVTDVVVLERDAIASGATSKATGCIRQQFTTEANICLSRESVTGYATSSIHDFNPDARSQIGTGGANRLAGRYRP